MTLWLKSRCESLIDQLKQQNRWRERSAMNFLSATHVEVGQSQYLQFASNDYLGFAGQPLPRCHLTGAGASPLVSGYSPAHERFEQELAGFLGFPCALYFHSGFSANEAALSSLVSKNDRVFADRLNHASLIDGVQKSRARQYRYHHLDMDHLRQLLTHKEIPPGGQRWIVTDGVFSMDGDTAPLDQLVALAREFDAALYVDDAHGFGVLGNGRGTLAEFNLDPKDVDVLMVTCGKAMGVMGAAVLASEAIRDILLQRSRNYVYSTSVSPAILVACSLALKRVKQADAHRAHVLSISKVLLDRLGALASERGYRICEDRFGKSHHPVHPLIVGSEKLVLEFKQFLLQQGILVGAIRPPTVAPNTARLRLSLNAEHQLAHVEQLCAALEQYS